MKIDLLLWVVLLATLVSSGLGSLSETSTFNKWTIAISAILLAIVIVAARYVGLLDNVPAWLQYAWPIVLGLTVSTLMYASALYWNDSSVKLPVFVITLVWNLFNQVLTTVLVVVQDWEVFKAVGTRGWIEFVLLLFVAIAVSVAFVLWRHYRLPVTS